MDKRESSAETPLFGRRQRIFSIGSSRAEGLVGTTEGLSTVEEMRHEVREGDTAHGSAVVSEGENASTMLLHEKSVEDGRDGLARGDEASRVASSEHLAHFAVIEEDAHVLLVTHRLGDVVLVEKIASSTRGVQDRKR